MFIPLLD